MINDTTRNYFGDKNYGIFQKSPNFVLHEYISTVTGGGSGTNCMTQGGSVWESIGSSNHLVPGTN